MRRIMFYRNEVTREEVLDHITDVSNDTRLMNATIHAFQGEKEFLSNFVSKCLE